MFRAYLKRRGWPVANLGRGMFAYLLLIDVIAAGAGLLAVISSGFRAVDEWKLLLVLGLAIVFEEGAAQVARLRFRLTTELDVDMTSVWTIAVAVALQPGQAVLVMAALIVYIWFRQRRPSGRILHRVWFSGSAIILACLSASLVAHADLTTATQLPAVLQGALTVVVAIVVNTAVNRSLIAVAMLASGAPVRAVFGTADENLVDVATLCLGGLVAVSLLIQPWLVVLALAPMVTLQRGALVRTLEAAATIDAKTGMLNALAWEQVAQKELSRGARNDTPVAVLIVDIDRFKLVNDRYGHLVGDAVLRAVGRCLTTEVREYDTVARFGGEEFVAVLPNAGDVGALVIAERLRQRTSELRVSQLVETVEESDEDWLAVSIGVASTEHDGAELPELLHAADVALYAAKAGGRNRVALAPRGSGPGSDRVSLR